MTSVSRDNYFIDETFVCMDSTVPNVIVREHESGEVLDYSSMRT